MKLKEKWGNLFDGYPINSLCDLYRFEAETCRNGPRRYCGKYRWAIETKRQKTNSALLGGFEWLNAQSVEKKIFTQIKNWKIKFSKYLPILA